MRYILGISFWYVTLYQIIMRRWSCSIVVSGPGSLALRVYTLLTIRGYPMPGGEGRPRHLTRRSSEQPSPGSWWGSWPSASGGVSSARSVATVWSHWLCVTSPGLSSGWKWQSPAQQLPPPGPGPDSADRDRALTQRHQGLRGRGPGCQAVRSPFNAVTHMPGVVIASLSRIQLLFVVRSTTVAA